MSTTAASPCSLQTISLTRRNVHPISTTSLRRPCLPPRSRATHVGISTSAPVRAAFPRREFLGASLKGLVPIRNIAPRASSFEATCVLEEAAAPEQLVGTATEYPPSKIWMSDVVVRKRRNYFKNRQWTFKDLTYAGFMAFMHGLCLFAPATFSWNAFGMFMGLYVVTGMLGITLSYHRNLSHKSFKVPKWLEYTFAYCGVQAVQVINLMVSSIRMGYCESLQ